MATENPSTPLSFTTLIHMITVKLSSANYLIWHSQILPFIESQDLVGHINGSIVPHPKFDSLNSQTPSDKYLSWKEANQPLFCLLRSSLTGEALAEIVGLFTDHDVWLALGTTFNHRSKAREIHLKDE
uniref:Retrotransposon Copia-like N-terminal domain-containing protein n=1 Tax=Populus davidiana TaxID=266767 RepID=A0A6M2EUZ5_9ROSI